MFPFSTFFTSFSPFFLRNKRNELSLGRGMGYYFSIWGILILLITFSSIVANWILVTPERVKVWSEKIPEFSLSIQEGILTETGFKEDPSTLLDDQDFIIFVSKTLTEIPVDKQRNTGIYILKDHISILQSQGAGEKEQKIFYSETPELKDLQIDKGVVSEKILGELHGIKRALSMIIAFSIVVFGTMVALWYCIWSFFWGFIVWLFSLKQKQPFTYEQAVGFVLSTFFPVCILSIMLMIAGVWFPFIMTVLFLLILGYNHLSFYTSE